MPSAPSTFFLRLLASLATASRLLSLTVSHLLSPTTASRHLRRLHLDWDEYKSSKSHGENRESENCQMRH
ncbi:hypothetical protein L2E82_20052 [Cichorium intybus]|uniref:Uncharacterized protein n=1 Tax=Cichorium intybus TaxID=13427 RepID=A0ACB9DSP4_CICIN|nr:hypothetical protein L2E82_20052 [Cichorium intybus]